MLLEPMEANPQIYDYAHFLDFRADGSVELTDGAGQLITLLAEGRYTLTDVSADAALVELSDLVELDPYAGRAPRRTIPSFAVRVIRESGVFAFRCEVAWNVADARRWPCLLYARRYAFEYDPLGFAASQQHNNLFYANAPAGLSASTRYYYPTAGRLELTADELLRRGVPEDAFWAPDREL